MRGKIFNAPFISGLIRQKIKINEKSGPERTNWNTGLWRKKVISNMSGLSDFLGDSKINSEKADLSKLQRMDQICTAKTCAKCGKHNTDKSTFVLKYCTIIVNMPSCCPTEQII